VLEEGVVRNRPSALSWLVVSVAVHKIEFESGPADVCGFERLIGQGAIDPDTIVAVVGKTEGNGGVNDFTRLLADRAYRDVLRATGTRGEEAIRAVPMVWSGGTDGVLCPHACVFCRVDEERTGLAVGVALSEEILPEDIGRMAMVEKVALAVERAMRDAGIGRVEDVHWVQTKTPLLTIEGIRQARERGRDTALPDPHGSMDLSNGTTALGVALALGEVRRERIGDETIGRDLSVYSSVASCSSGVELDCAQVVLLGNAGGGGRHRIGHSVMRDALDQDAVYKSIRSAGLALPDRPRPEDLQGRVVNVFAKCEADPSGRLRGRRQVMLDDSDVHHHRHAKAAVGAVVAAAVGDPAVFVSVGAMHQGPPGGARSRP
jgi:cyanuric acid amidohydrolase